MTQDPEIQRAILGLRMSAPFFAGLLLFADIRPREGLGTAATDGLNILYDPDYFASLSRKQIQAVLMHEVLHCALQHVPRRQSRIPSLWNHAADIVVNGMIAALEGFELPDGTIRDAKLEHFCAEEVYRLLERDAVSVPAWLVHDLLGSDPTSSSAGFNGSAKAQSPEQISHHWRHALSSAKAIADASPAGHGSIPAGFERELGFAEQANIDWRTVLWRFAVRTPCDFEGFDRRFVHQGLYLEELAGSHLKVHVAIDSSGSVSADELAQFVEEVRGIAGAYPHLICDLYYIDAAVHGPYRIDRTDEFPKPIGGGGTSFIPFFNAVDQDRSIHHDQVCVYLTDGDGDFPTETPDYPVLWVIVPGGVKDREIPFGEVIRMV